MAQTPPTSNKPLKQANASYEIIAIKDHDPSYFTQGLLVDDATMLESSGLYGRSRIKRYDKISGKVFVERALPKSIFAEGITLFEDSIYMLTWKARKMYILNSNTFQTKGIVDYKTEGWGLTHNNDQLIMSDGSHIIRFRDPETFKVNKKLEVKHRHKNVRFLNELEFAKGLIWANIYMTPKIITIDPQSGQVKQTFNFPELVKKHQGKSPNQVLNGIAYDPEFDAFWITGKLWPKRYLVKFHLNEPTQSNKSKTTHAR